MLSFFRTIQSTIASLSTLVLGLSLIVLPTGCNRSFYRRTADRDAYCVVTEKGAGPNWSVGKFTINPDPQSRFHDPTCRTDPQLPIPAPQLYKYQLPLLSTADAKPRDLEVDLGNAAPEKNRELAPRGPNDPKLPVPTEPERTNPNVGTPLELELRESTSASASEQLRLIDSVASPNNLETQTLAHVAGLPEVATVSWATSGQDESQPELIVPAEIDTDQSPDAASTAEYATEADWDAFEFQSEESVLRIPPIPTEAWSTLPQSCLRRMLEFPEIRETYVRSFDQQVDESMLDPAARVTLENILELALINSRNYQRTKEQLYARALQLSFQRFDFELQFFPRGNGTSVNYDHTRVGGVEVNGLAVGSGVGISKSLYTAGELVSRVSNDVLLTFNGANGYSSNVGSAILVELTQPLIQRDIRFEALTQAERDVVYAARDFVRFRKQLFRDLAVQYYTLLLAYRNIAINTQDYFSNLDGFNRAAAQYEVGDTPRFQVDQFEQNVLSSRGRLINVCNSLEGLLDRLKLNVGLPPEMPLNLDLSELESLTLSDEATVVQEQIRRARIFANQQLEEETVGGAVAAAAELARRMLSLSKIQDQLARELTTSTEENKSDLTKELEILVARLESEDRRSDANEAARVLAPNETKQRQILPAQVYLRKEEVVERLLRALEKEIQLIELLEADAPARVELPTQRDKGNSQQELEDAWEQLVQQFEKQVNLLRAIPDNEKAQRLPTVIEEMNQILSEANALQQRIIRRLEEYGIELFDDPNQLRELSMQVVQSSLRSADEEIGLRELKVDMDEAMLSALVNRLDLMNQRGALADSWRQIKYAGDSLRSILNVSASQSIRTRTGSNNPFDFTFDDSTTRLGLQFDAPLNRRSERNIFRLALINYNLAFRNLIEAEDQIKLSIRDDLRDLALDQNQYEISIASAALAYERVNSTRIQLAVGRGNITARDFLEAQQAYTQSLSGVAQQHIGYIVDRIEFFLDLEQLQVDQWNYWPELRNESYPFLPSTDFATINPYPYGRLSCGPRYSDCILRQEKVPAGDAQNWRPSEILNTVP